MKSNPNYDEVTGNVAGELEDYGMSQGAVGVASWETSDGAQPTAAETVTIGGDVYEWNGAGANINVAIGGSYSESLNNLIAAINASGSAHVIAAPDHAHPATTLVDLRSAEAPGGPVAVGPLPATLAGSVDPWTRWVDGNAAKERFSKGQVTFNADNAAAAFQIPLTFTPTAGKVYWSLHDAAGAVKATDMTVTVGGGNFVTVNPIAGGVTPPIATDVLVYEARE